MDDMDEKSLEEAVRHFNDFVITDDYLDEQVDLFYGIVSSIISDGVDQVIPAIAITSFDSNRSIFDDAEPKKTNAILYGVDPGSETAWSMLCRQLVRDQLERFLTPTVFCAAFEAWYVKREQEDEPVAGRVEDEPDRQECVSIYAVSIDGRISMTMVYLLRDENNNFVIENVKQMRVKDNDGEDTYASIPRQAKEFFRTLAIELMNRNKSKLN